jgi:superfamily II DNA or RNA helicase
VSSKELATGEVWAQPLSIGRNIVRQLLVPETTICVDTAESVAYCAYGRWDLAQASDRDGPLALIDPQAQDATANWTGQRDQHDGDAVVGSWANAFHFGEPDAAGALRRPQVGAVHAAVGHFLSSSGEPGLIVMPTGTGKTESMLAIAVHERIRHLVVLVPTNALREQIANKFLGLGILQREGIVDKTALRPSVAELRRGIPSVEEAQALLAASQVIVATPDSLRACSDEARAMLLSGSTHLFVDEAHHAPAATWGSIVEQFEERPVLLFTATPHRRDRKGLQGRQIFRYSLAAAQQAGYYRQIEYTAIVSLRNPDRTIAEAAVERLRDDLARGLDHIVMARVSSVARTEQLLAMYADISPEYKPIVIHSALGAKAKRLAVAALRSRDSRIIICVDMLGEGFDLPQLKVAALHDPRKSLSPLIQLVGRFTRTSDDDTLGTASVFAARDAQSAMSPLSDLFREDADWNLVMRDVSERLTLAAERQASFDTSFAASAGAIPTATLRPTTSAVAYRTPGDWWDPALGPGLFQDGSAQVSALTVGDDGKVAWFIVSRFAAVPWSNSADLEDATHELIIMRFDPDRRLLFIHGSEKSSRFEELAGLVLGAEGELLKEAVAFRVLSGVGYPVPTNVGLVDVIDGDNRFTMHTGGDVTAGLEAQNTGTKSQTHIAIKGFDSGERVAISAARSGRFWSPRSAQSIQDWVDWCDYQGGKLLDSSVDPGDLIRGFIVPEPLTAMPEEVLIAVEWPALVYETLTALPDLRRNGLMYSLLDVELHPSGTERGATFRFALQWRRDNSTEGWDVEYELEARDRSLVIRAVDADVTVCPARGEELPFAQWLTAHPPTLVLSSDTIILEGRQVLRARATPAFDRDKLICLPWTGVNRRVESQGRDRKPDSIQHYVSRYVQEHMTFDVLIDDDGAGEIADLVGLRISDRELLVTLIHCKYSSAAAAGARVEDLYEVCGQAIRSIGRRRRTPLMLSLLAQRAGRKQERGFLPFEVGDEAALLAVCEKAAQLRPRFEVIVAQPGLSKAQVRDDQLPLLAGVANYLRHAGGAKLTVLVAD